MPEISTGYWNAMKRPSHAASSGFMASKSLPLNSTSPWVTWKVSRRASTCARVLLPEPFGPMMECTSPAFTFRLTPFRISWFSTLTCRFLISSMALSNTTFQAHAQQFLRLDGKLHGQLAEHLFAEAVDDHRNRIFLRQAALLQIEELVVADLRCGRFVFHARRRVLHLDVGEGVGATLVANQQGVTLRVLANVDHLGAGVGLLTVVSERQRVELAHGVVALKDDARVLPGDGRAGLHLRPGNLRVHTCAFAALGDEVIDPA